MFPERCKILFKKNTKDHKWGIKPTFLCSEAVLGLSGTVFMLAGVAATGEDEFFSIISAGIFLCKISTKMRKNANDLRSSLKKKKDSKRIKKG